MSEIQATVTGYTRYRGREGQLAFLLHRLTGLGVLLFLIIHIVDTSFVYFAPQLYDDVIMLYRSTIFGLGELALVFCLIFHGINGMRIAWFDLFAPESWKIKTARGSVRGVLMAAIVVWIPAAGMMLYNLLRHNYGFFGG